MADCDERESTLGGPPRRENYFIALLPPSKSAPVETSSLLRKLAYAWFICWVPLGARLRFVRMYNAILAAFPQRQSILRLVVFGLLSTVAIVFTTVREGGFVRLNLRQT